MEMKLEVVPIPVSDLERARQFYSEQLGFVIDHDTRISDETRIIQLTPPGSACSIVLGAGTDKPPGSVQGLHLVVSDIEAIRNQIVERGVDASPIQQFGENGLAEGRGGDWNSFVFFGDPDGNGWVLQERPAGT